MYRIRLHGRGGQGLKTASRLLGTALFLEGFEVQDAPRYGAERRGAPRRRVRPRQRSHRDGLPLDLSWWLINSVWCWASNFRGTAGRRLIWA